MKDLTKPTQTTPANEAPPTREEVQRFAAAQAKEIETLLTTEKQIDCLNPRAWIILAAHRLNLMCKGKREAELAILTKAWEKSKEA